MRDPYEDVTVYFQSFKPPLTVDKLFTSLDGLEEGELRTQYTDFLEYVLSKLDDDFDPTDPIEGFDVREGDRRLIFESEGYDPRKVEPTFKVSDSEIIEQLKYQNDSLRDINEKLHRVRVKDRKDNQSFWWAMLALLGLIVAGFFGFGDH